MNTVLVIGAGVWGQALAVVFSKCVDVHLLIRTPAKLTSVENKLSNLNYNTITCITEIKDLKQYSLVVVATPVHALRSVLSNIKSLSCKKWPDLIITSKGIEQDTGKLVYQIVEDISPCKNYGVLLGPSFAQELINDTPTFIALSSFDSNFTIKWINNLQIKNFKIYGHSDVIGACVASALKNIIALAVGICCGLSLGQNTISAVITQGLAEMKRFILAMGGDINTVYGLNGLGDLILTCNPLSRNYQVGLKLAQNLAIADIINDLQQTAEGVATSKVVYIKSQELNINMPVCSTVYQIIYQGLSAQSAIKQLMGLLFCQK